MTEFPRPPELPQARPRARVGGPAIETVSVRLKTLTPVLGGAHRAREIDRVDVIRPLSLKGALRMWWRALYGGQYASPGELYDAETRLWGGVPRNEVRRAAVELAVEVHNARSIGIDASDVAMSASDAYGLWTARAERGTNAPPAPRRDPGLEFTVVLRYPRPQRTEVLNALRAWILFGGYGGRTRRGLGSLTVLEGPDGAGAWLPGEPHREALARLFDVDPLDAKRTGHFHDLPQLAGAELVCGTPQRDAIQAWQEALGWLQAFRQGAARSRVTATPSSFARDHNPGRGRVGAGRSFWPEPDKVRHLAGRGPWAHTPRLNRTPVWPRAGFGLPIIGQFQTRDASGNRYPDPEPGNFKLYWQDGKGIWRDRLASALIVKAMPLADGRFVPIALWLHRDYPAGGKAGLNGDPRACADFDLLNAPGDPVLYAPLGTPQVLGAARGHRLRRAFMDWLVSSRSARRIA